MPTNELKQAQKKLEELQAKLSAAESRLESDARVDLSELDIDASVDHIKSVEALKALVNDLRESITNQKYVVKQAKPKTIQPTNLEADRYLVSIGKMSKAQFDIKYAWNSLSGVSEAEHNKRMKQ